ncbi:T9SS type A sorting domain-containing protein [Flavobacterium sp. NRK F7]|uniref:T9SS type A sorting domain-containing protein n=1 Tax=Flavobacterium sp. NRK F7 TaxID=2954930 RepID=UPI002090D099|nr:T9SS type A sorting domain-containing protein [Flavobacterium sp. NRK F7]MCO6163410.1 T9SS type A sorting domain-containing protein [Flavobacterium sp. NRK F7]
MKQHYFLLISLLFSHIIYSQNTYIPDDGFEQLLIDLSVDFGPLDNYVPTDNISGLEDLNILSNYNISDLTGLQDFTSIEALYIDNNPITTIDLSGNPILYDVSLTNMNLTSITFSDASIIAFLDVSNNALTSLDVSSLPNLQYLNILGNQITDLNLNSNTQLTSLNVAYNALNSLFVKNGTNTILNTFNATNNPLLTCIEVDNGTNATAGVGNYASWLKDATANYSGNCNSLDIATVELNFNVQVYPNPIRENQILNIHINSNTFVFSVYDFSGKLIDKKNMSSKIYTTNHLSKGIYFFQIQTETAVYSDKLIIQ